MPAPLPYSNALSTCKLHLTGLSLGTSAVSVEQSMRTWTLLKETYMCMALCLAQMSRNRAVEASFFLTHAPLLPQAVRMMMMAMRPVAVLSCLLHLTLESFQVTVHNSRSSGVFFALRTGEEQERAHKNIDISVASSGRNASVEPGVSWNSIRLIHSIQHTLVDRGEHTWDGKQNKPLPTWSHASESQTTSPLPPASASLSRSDGPSTRGCPHTPPFSAASAPPTET